METSDDEFGSSSVNPTESNFCGVCGMTFSTRQLRIKHENAHKRTIGWKCSCCGCLAFQSSDRNKHEKRLHNLIRITREDIRSRDAIRIRKSQLSALANVGFLLVEVQRTARPSALPPNDPAATIEELESIMHSKPPRAYNFESCPLCGFKNYTSRRRRDNHIAKHTMLDNAYYCSLCGIQEHDAAQRNKHEMKVHNFTRADDHQKHKEPIKISQNDLGKYNNVGTNFDQVQQSALGLSKVKADSLIETRKRSRVIDVITLDDSDDEISSLSIQSPVRFRSSAPFRQTETIASIGQHKTNGDFFSIQLNIEPQFLYYDYKAIGSELPIKTWKKTPRSEVLVLHLKRREWNGDLLLGEPICHFMLSDVCDHFLTFAKPNAQLLAKEFAHIALKFPSFVQLMEHVKQMNLRSTMVIANNATKKSLHRLVSTNFVVT
ncbi:hypothetical protein M3Y98_00710400 [Aphelenchoides besseyi]|nr:hypothetical protein M3Y98_00710400 [Aphelenchoides besseyi]KAI6210337.1 hypothetical protein M3Y96_00317600 [Aphelenchoides besseyi]